MLFSCLRLYYTLVLSHFKLDKSDIKNNSPKDETELGYDLGMTNIIIYNVQALDSENYQSIILLNEVRTTIKWNQRYNQKTRKIKIMEALKQHLKRKVFSYDGYRIEG